MLFNIILKSKKHLFSIGIITIYLFYKIHLEKPIFVSGDELNSILIYSSNLKTFLLKNVPGNVVFFHFFGLVKSHLFGFDIVTFRSINFLFLIIIFYIFYKQFKNFIFVYLVILLLLSSNLLIYLGIYVGYIFSSLIFLIIFFLLYKPQQDKYVQKIIFFLLFIQSYNHLVNIYLVIPIIITMFVHEEYKKKYIKNFIFYFIFPTSLFYTFSIILTGLHELRLPSYDMQNIIHILKEQLSNVFYLGVKKIFFYEVYQAADSFSIKVFLIKLYNFDKMYFLIFIIIQLFSLIFIKNNKTHKKIFLIFLLHFLIFFIINKDPAPRIFTGFIFAYIFNIFFIFTEFKIKINRNINNILIVSCFILIYQLNYSEIILKSSRGPDFVKNDLKKEILLNECKLINNNFLEVEKKTYYYQYLNVCKKKFNLFEFRSFYKA